jgi:hypothetical protein
VFHIAPSNIPVNFAFSWIFGILSGNANVVRVPSKQFEQTEIICAAIIEAAAAFPEILQCNTFIRYPHSDEITAQLCLESDARIIWGGDTTVSHIRSFASKPRCVDVVFPDRYSFCIIDGKSVLESSDNEIKRLAENFYNDTYLMDQNACSSPRLILWQNADANNAACNSKEKFWEAVFLLANKKYELQTKAAVDKYVQLCKDAISFGGEITSLRKLNILYRVNFSSLPEVDISELRGYGGYFYESDLSCLDRLVPYINEKYQTLTYFGVDPKALKDFVVTNRLRGIDRISPVGKAMDIGLVWDGYDLINTLSRVIDG